MSIGIIGSGAIGSSIARLLARARIPALIANSRGPESLVQLTSTLGPYVQPAHRTEAAAADIVFVAVPWSKIPAALNGLAPWAGRVVVDANNPIEQPLFRAADLSGRTSSEVFAELVPGARVVKAFNHLAPPVLTSDPRAEGGRRVLFLSGDDSEAKRQISDLIKQLQFYPIDLGELRVGARLVQFPGGPLPTLNLVRFS